MDSSLLHLSRSSHASLVLPSLSAVCDDASFVHPDPPQLFYEHLIQEEQLHNHDDGDKFVSFLDFHSAFLTAGNSTDPCYSSEFSDPASHDFDIRPFLGSLPDQVLPFQFDGEVYDDACVPISISDNKFRSNFQSASFPQQHQHLYDPVMREMQHDTSVTSDDFTGLPSLPVLANPSGAGGECVSVTNCQLYMPFELESSGTCGSTFSSPSDCQYDLFSYDDSLQLNESLIGSPSVQILPQSPDQREADLAFCIDPLGAFPPLVVPATGLSACCLSDSTVYTVPSSMQNSFPSNNVQPAPLASHDLRRPCSIPMCNFAVTQSAPTLVSSASPRMGGHVEVQVGAIGNAEPPASDSLQALEEYRNAQMGLNVESCQDEEGASVRENLPRGRMHVDARRKHGRVGNRCRALAGTGPDESQLPEVLNDKSIAQLLKGKERRTRKSQLQSQIEPTTFKEPSVSTRKRRARKTVERKLNEAILIFNNMDWVSGNGEETIAKETTTKRYRLLSHGNRLTGLAVQNSTKCTKDDVQNVGYDVESEKFSEYDSKGEDEADIKSPDKANPASEFPTSVSGDMFSGELPSYPQTISGVQDGSVVEWYENANFDLPQGEKLCACTCTSHLNAKVVTGVDYNGNEDRGSSHQTLSSLFTSDPTARVHSPSRSDHTFEGLTIFECNEEFDTKISEDNTDYPCVSDAAVELKTEANARKLSAEGIRRTDVWSEAIIEAQLQIETKSEERANRTSSQEENKSSVSAATTSSVAVGIKGESESLPQKDDDSSSNSTSDGRSNIAANIVQKSQRDAQEGRCGPLSPLATVRYVDPAAELKYVYEPGTDSSTFSEDPCHKSLVSASDFDLEGIVETDSARVGQHEKPKIGVPSRGEAAIGSDPTTKVVPETNCNVERDVGCSEAFTASPVSYSKVEFDISASRKGKARVDSLISRNSDNAFHSGVTRTDEPCIYIVSDEIPSQGIQRVQTPTSLNSAALRRRGKSARISTVHVVEDVKLSPNSTAKLSTESLITLQRKSSLYGTQEANVDSPEKQLAVLAMCSLDSKGAAQCDENYVRNSYLDVHSSTFCESMVQSDRHHKGETSRGNLKTPSYGMLASGEQANPLEDTTTLSEDLCGNENLNAHQQKLMKILTDFIESGYGATALPPDAAQVINGDQEEPDIYAELSRGTIVVPSARPKCGKGKAQKARWRSISKQGRLPSGTEAGSTSSSPFHPPEICDSNNLQEEEEKTVNRAAPPKSTLHRPAPPKKVHKTRSRSRADSGGLRPL